MPSLVEHEQFTVCTRDTVCTTNAEQKLAKRNTVFIPFGCLSIGISISSARRQRTMSNEENTAPLKLGNVAREPCIVYCVSCGKQ